MSESVWMYYETDGDSGYYSIKLFKERIDAEIHSKNVNKGYGKVEEIEVYEKEEEQKKPSVYSEIECPNCGGPMISRNGQFGKFWGCKQYPNCSGTRDSMGRSKQDKAKERDLYDPYNSVDNERPSQTRTTFNKKK